MKVSLLVVTMTAFVFVASGPTLAGGDVDAGMALAKKCAGCHGKSGEGKKDNPPIAGMEESAFIQDMNDYKSGKKEHKAMNSTSKKLSDDDIANLAAYYATLK